MLLEIPIYKQGELDFTCGLYDLVSVAEHFGIALNSPGAPLAAVIGEKEEGLNADEAEESRIMPLVWGVGIEAMPKLAEGMGLKCEILDPAGDLDALKEAYLSIVLVFSHFDHPEGGWPSYADGHYLIVMNDEGLLYVGDTHPWKPHLRPIDDNSFMEMWMHERLELRGWALTFPMNQEPEEEPEKEPEREPKTEPQEETKKETE